MARRFYVLINGRKRYLPPGLVKTVGELRQAAQNAADNLGCAVTGGWDQPRSYRRNPVNPHLKRAGLELASFLRGHDITADRPPARPRKAKAAAPRAALAKASKKAKRSPSKDGAAARRAGYGRADNPYEPGSMGARLWLNGWGRVDDE